MLALLWCNSISDPTGALHYNHAVLKSSTTSTSIIGSTASPKPCILVAAGNGMEIPREGWWKDEALKTFHFFFSVGLCHRSVDWETSLIRHKTIQVNVFDRKCSVRCENMSTFNINNKILWQFLATFKLHFLQTKETDTIYYINVPQTDYRQKPE